MSTLPPQQISFGSQYPDLGQFCDRIGIQIAPFSTARTIDVGRTGASFVVLPSSVVAGVISVSQDTSVSGGVLAVPLVGSVGAGSSVAPVSGPSGEILNAVRLRRSATWTWAIADRLLPLATAAGDEIFGLVQCASGTADGESIGASNLQISFVSIAANGALSLATVVGPIDFELPYAVSEKDYPLTLI